MTWPRAYADRQDQEFADRMRGTHPKWIEWWERREICGCGDVLETETERRDGVCETCVALGTRTPRPMEVLER